MIQGKEEKRYAGHRYLEKFSWLVFSDTKKGFFCNFCPFSINAQGGHNNSVSLKKLVTVSLTNFSKLLGNDGDLIQHEQAFYHKAAVAASREFLNGMDNPELKILNRLDTQRQLQIEDNRLRLKPIIESIIFLGRQNIPLRGHRDDGPLHVNKVDSPINEGNFRELLKYRIKSGDFQFAKHLEESSIRSTYISKTIQNELIICCGDEILNTIVNRIRVVKFYSVILDETTDISQISHLTLVLRYQYKQNVYKSFIGFINVHKEIDSMETGKDKPTFLETKMSGTNLGKIACICLKRLNLDFQFCVSITSDGCSVMVSETCGAVAEIQKEAKKAVYSPCENHKLNLSISQSSSVQLVRNAVGTIKETITFFHSSAKLSYALKSVMGKKVSGLCETRWVERHEGVLQFRLLLPEIIETLEVVSSWEDVQTAAKARTLMLSLSDGPLIVAIICLSEVLNCTLPLSRFLQTIQTDLKSAQEMFHDTFKLLQNKRDNSDQVFSGVFKEIVTVAEKLDVQIVVPRTCRRQRNRANYPTNDPEMYYRQSVFIPLLDNVLQDYKLRFSEETLALYNFTILFPDSSTWHDEELLTEAIQKLAKKYHVYFDKSEEMVKNFISSELDLWKIKWQERQCDKSIDVLQLLKICDEFRYPTLNTLYKIFITLPFSAASAERTFSTLRRIKSWLRATMSDERFSGLALMSINYDIKIDIELVLDRFSRLRKHRLEFVL